MKKILRNIFLTILVLILAGGIGVWYTLFGTAEKPDKGGKNYVVDAYGTTYLAVVDDEGVTYVVIADEEGNRNAHKFENGVVGENVGNVNEDVKADELPTNYTGPNVNVTADPNEYEGDVVTEKTEPTTKPSKPEDKPNNKPTKPSEKPNNNDPYRLEAYRIEKYHKIIAGGTFLMETTMEDPEMGSTPVIMAIKNGNTYVETAMNMDNINMSCKVIYQKNTGATYLIMDNWKKYTKVPADMLGDSGGLDMATALQEEYAREDISNIEVSKVKINGKELIRESYNNGRGGTVNYYFEGENLVRRDDVSSGGEVESTIFTRFTTDVPDSCFEVPAGYGYLNLSWLQGLM